MIVAIAAGMAATLGGVGWSARALRATTLKHASSNVELWWRAVRGARRRASAFDRRRVRVCLFLISSSGIEPRSRSAPWLLVVLAVLAGCDA